MILKCIAVDDEMPAIEKMKTYIDRVPYLSLQGCFDNAEDAKNYLNENTGIDAIFVDINMPDMNGLDFVNELAEPRPHVVFITAYPYYALDSYRAGAVDYLLKPYSFEEFCRAAGRLVEKVAAIDIRQISRTAKEEPFFIKVDNRWLKLDVDDIEFIRGYGDYLRIYVRNREKPLVTYMTMTAIRQLLPDEFLQVHRSYIVNITNGITAIEKGRIISNSGHEIPVGDSYRDELMAYLTGHSIAKDSKK